MIDLREKDGATIFGVRVVPRSSRSQIIGELNGALKIKLNAPPIDGAANAELIKILAKYFNVPKNAIKIVGEQTAKNKQIKISDISSDKIRQILDLN